MDSREHRKTPRWVWGLVLGFALVQPCLILGTQYFPPEDTRPTGLHIADSALFLQSMAMFETGFATPYATAQDPGEGAGPRYYAVPHLWWYGLLGAVSNLFRVPHLWAYALANGLCAAFYLWVIFRLLQTLAPLHAPAAFLLFVLSGGPGGFLFLFAGLLGGHGSPGFELYFQRFALYDLMEGPHLNPMLYAPRSYYTLSLACCLGGLNAFLRADRGRRAWQALWFVPVLAGSFINARYAVFTLGVLILYLVAARGPSPSRWRRAALYAVPAFAGGMIAYAVLRMNPVSMRNHVDVGNMAMWFSPFVCVAWLHLLVLARPLWRSASRLERPLQYAAAASAGYLAAYAGFYVLYQGYYGNLFSGRDGSVAAAISDVSLLGAVAGAAAWWGFRRWWWREAPRSEARTYDWTVLWLLGFLAVSLSGFGAGWFLRFGPQRVQVFLWLPLCLFAAVGLSKMKRPSRYAAWSALLGFGMLSSAVAALFFQAPLGRAEARGPYMQHHAEVMSLDDALLIEAIGAGTVLAPVLASDAVVLAKGNPVVFGIGSFNLTRVPYLELRGATETFFAAGTADAERQAIAERYEVDYVYCPDTWAVAPKTVSALEGTAWLELVKTSGRGAVFQVVGGKPLQGASSG